jgi:hypothetical protein
VRSGGPELAQELEVQGYDWLRTDEGNPIEGGEESGNDNA